MTTDKKYYDGKKLLSKLDINRKKPVLYMVSSNRSAGKTTFFHKKLIDDFFNYDKKFCLIYRYKNQMNSVGEKMFSEISRMWYPEWSMTERKIDGGAFLELILVNNDDDEIMLPCGYAVPINTANQLKTSSHLLSDTAQMFMDEFQSESGDYCKDEVNKFLSLYSSIARGQGEQSRHVPVYMASNNISLLNPYYSALGIAERLRSDTKFLRGNGWILEVNFNDSASIAMSENPLINAFSAQKYAKNLLQSVYLNDDYAFIQKPDGRRRYLCTLIYQGKYYSVAEYPDLGVLYCSDTYDMNFPVKISVTLGDHNINQVMCHAYASYISYMREIFEIGQFRFKNLASKELILKLLAY